ncbi:MAG: hypothetical protein ACI4WT_10785 [Oligosphaeraceae bacterium]
MTNIYTLLQDELKQKNYKGTTYEEMGSRAGLSKSHICKLLNSNPEERLARLSFSSVLSLYPWLETVIAAHFADGRGTATNTNSPHSVAAGGDVRIEHAPEAGEASEKLEALTRFVLSSSLSDAEKVEAMKLLH